MLSAPWIRTRAQATPDRIAIETPEQALCYAELYERARTLAGGLAERGARPGDVVAVLLPNSVDFAVLVHAADLLGIGFLPLNARLTPRELTYPLGDSAARLLVHRDDALGEKARQSARSAPGVETVALEALPSQPAAFAEPAPDPDAPFAILYTSGTTGRPKGACLSRRNFVASAIASALHSGSLPDERWLACMPLFHVGGLSILVRSVLYGTTAILHEQFDPEAVNDALDEQGITLLSLTATMLLRLLDARGERPPPPSLRCLLLGGGPCPPALVKRAANAGLPVAPTYGLTESCSQVATRLLDDPSPNALTPLPGLEVRVVGDEGAALDAGTVGEIWIRGDPVMRRYLSGNGDNPGPNGWLRTGDLGTLDARGRLQVHDRRSDLIISGGENVYPAEVEAALMEHPAIGEAAVRGIEDATYGQRPEAWLVLAAGAPLPSDAELERHCRGQLAGYKVPARFRVVKDLPRTSAGKVRRHALGR